MKVWLFTLGAGIALFATACGGSDHSMSSATTAVTVPGDASFNAADVRFAQAMIPHHAQAVEMADLALANSTDPAVVELAAGIKAAQDPEIVTMQGWLKAWGQPETMSGVDSSMGGMDRSMDDGGMGMMSADEMKGLADADGAAFDALFLEMMIEHHEGAIAMAQQVKADGEAPEVVTLASAIITGQEAEIARMKQLLDQG